MPAHSFLQKLRELRKDPNATWSCPEQRAATEAVWENKRDVIIGMRTGAGKTLPCILPAFFEEGRTLIVVPLHVLLVDWIRRLTAMDVHHEVFTGGEMIGKDTKIVLVSADVSRFPQWELAVKNMNDSLVILRLVLEEPTEYWVSDSYRPNLEGIYALRAMLACQMVAPTGTMPRNHIRHLGQKLGLLRPFVISMSSHRPELKYELSLPSNNRPLLDHKTLQVIQTETSSSEWLAVGRVIIFVTSKVDGERLSDAIKCDFLHSAGEESGLTREEQTAMYESWIRGERSIVLIATSALTAGADCPHVHLIIFYGLPGSAITFQQQASRGGRDGRVCKVLLLPFNNLPPNKDSTQMRTYRGYYAMHSLAFETKNLHFPPSCLRWHIGVFLDGCGLPCQAIEGAELCSHCENSESSFRCFIFLRCSQAFRQRV